MNLTISQKGLVLVLLPLLFQLAFVLLVVRLQRDHADAQFWATHSQEVIATVREVQVDVAEAQSAARGFALTRDPAFAEPFHRADRELPTRLDRLDELVGDNPDQAARAAAIRAEAVVLLGWQREVVRLVRDGAGDEGAGRVKSGRGRALMSELRRDVGAFLAEEERLNRARSDALGRSRGRLNVLVVSGGFVAVAGTALLAYLFRRGIGRRFAALTANTRRLAGGQDLPPPLPGGDEIARLDRAFRDMAAELGRASDRVRDLYDNAPCGYHSVDPDGTLLQVNRTELRWLGYEAGEVVGRVRFADLLAPASRGAYREAFARLKEHGRVTDLELELAGRDGTSLPVLVNSSAVRDEAGRYLSSRTTLTDITERRRAEEAVRRANEGLERRVAERTAELAGANARLSAEVAERARAEAALRLSEYRYRSLVAASAQVVWITNPAGELVGDAPEWQAYTGQTPAEARGLGWMAAVHPEDRDRVAAAWRAAAASRDTYEVEYRLRVHDGAWRDIRARGVPIREPDGTIREWVGTCTDVTARKRAEEEVRRRVAELAEANRDLAEKNAENEMFVYSVSHDLRSPLVNLQGFSKELEKAAQSLATHLADDGVPPAVREAASAVLGGKVAKSVGFIRAAVMRLSGIIDALLRLSRAGRVEYRWARVDVGRAVARVVESLQGTITGRRARVAVGGLPPAWGDATALEQVFANLIGNALTYLDPERPGEVEVGCLPPGRTAPGRTSSRTTGWASPRATGRESSRRSSAPTPGSARARGWGWRSSRGWPSGTGAGSGSSPSPARGAPSSSACRRPERPWGNVVR